MGDLHLGRPPLNPIVVLGATGSIGRQTIEVATRIGVPIVGLAANRPSADLIELADRFPDAAVCAAAADDSSWLGASRPGTVYHGDDGLEILSASPNVTVVNGVVGAAGLRASLAALESGNRLALANKESLVAGGDLVTAAAERGGGELVPVDSEHSAIWQCLAGEAPGDVARLVLTASGGPFRGKDRSSLESVTVDEALDHPTWSMGPRITIDSATLMNKAFEVIEAHHLFAIDYDHIDVLVHPQSIVHSMVEFRDGVVKAELGYPDMRKPIQAAITHPERVAVEERPRSLAGADLTFEEPDTATFRCLQLGYEAGRRGGTATAVLNAADEVAVAAFLDREIAFLEIAEVVERVLDAHDPHIPGSVDEVAEADAWARRFAAECIGLSR